MKFCHCPHFRISKKTFVTCLRGAKVVDFMRYLIKLYAGTGEEPAIFSCTSMYSIGI